MQQLLDMARAGPLTLLYDARDTQHNEAAVLAACLRHLLDHTA
ncbi:hypothetical protein MSKU15_1804 [Komagataeibacter diospyri]|nr:hypothetical protein MSKU15_1804 [Komagataeibacter diospyri]